METLLNDSNKFSSYFKKFTALFISLCLGIAMFTITAEASARQLVYEQSPWKVYMDSPDNTKSYYHLHFYNKNTHVYCLRLDNMQACDGTEKNRDQVPKKVRENVMKVKKVQNAVEYHQPEITSSWVKAIIKPLALAGAGILVVLAAVNIFAGPIDDIAAYALLMAVAGW